jgi:hypothetical protein
VRGDPSITWVDWTGNAFSCEDDGGAFSQCDDRHRLTTILDDDDAPIAEEPFLAFADPVGEFALVSHLTSGVITLIDSPRAGTPLVADAIGGLFQAKSAFLPGSSGIAGRNPGADDLVYVGSHTDDRVQMFTVERPADGTPYLVQSNFFLLNAVGNNNGGSGDTRSLSFAAGGDRLLLVNRLPPTLQIYDTSLDLETGMPRNTLTGSYDVCRESSGMAVGDGGNGELALVSCFRDGTVYIIDAQGRRPTDAVVTVGRGPYDVAISPMRQKAYVTNFLEDTVGVIELDPEAKPDANPESRRQYREVLRIGKTRQ